MAEGDRDTVVLQLACKPDVTNVVLHCKLCSERSRWLGVSSICVFYRRFEMQGLMLGRKAARWALDRISSREAGQLDTLSHSSVRG